MTTSPFRLSLAFSYLLRFLCISSRDGAYGGTMGNNKNGIPEVDIRADPCITQSLKCNVLLVADELSYKVELEEKWIGHLREGKLTIRCKKWLTKEWMRWDWNTDMAVTIYSLLRAELVYEIRHLHADIDPDSDVAVFKFYVVT
jgi:hypothetical protein